MPNRPHTRVRIHEVHQASSVPETANTMHQMHRAGLPLELLPGLSGVANNVEGLSRPDGVIQRYIIGDAAGAGKGKSRRRVARLHKLSQFTEAQTQRVRACTRDSEEPRSEKDRRSFSTERRDMLAFSKGTQNLGFASCRSRQIRHTLVQPCSARIGASHRIPTVLR